MSTDHIITVSDEVEKALIKKAEYDGITIKKLLENQVLYYLACALFNDLECGNPINTKELSIKERAEVISVTYNQGFDAGVAKVAEILNNR